MSPKSYSGKFVMRHMKYMTLITRVWRLSDLWHLTFWRKLNFEKPKDCDVRTEPETCPPAEDSCYDPCQEDDSPCSSTPKCPPPYMPDIRFPDPDPYKLKFWRMLSLCIALPVVAIMSVITFTREESKEPRQPFHDLPYMCRRTKPFPWGDGNHTLFHNPVKNPIPPHGYEAPDPNAKNDTKNQE